MNVSTDAILHVQLQPYQFYNCCVAAVNEAGRGSSSCQTVITHEAGKLYIQTQRVHVLECIIYSCNHQ